MEIEKLYDTFDYIFKDYPEVKKYLKTYIFDNVDTFIDVIPLIQKSNYIYEDQKLFNYKQ